MSPRFGALEMLRKAAWESITTRREFEWRVSLAFWGLIAAFTAGVATNRIEAGFWTKLTVSGIPILLGVSHVIWLWGLRRACKIDKKEEGDLRAEMRREISYFEDPELTKLRKEVAEPLKQDRRQHWHLASQSMATVALTALAIASVWLLLPGEKLPPGPTATALPAAKQAARQP